MADKAYVTISRRSDSVAGFPPSCSSGFHHMHITIPGDFVHISHEDGNMLIYARWDKDQLQMPRLTIDGKEYETK